MFSPLRILLLVCTMALPGTAFAQSAGIAFGGLKQDPTQPVEIQADQLQVNQADGSAVFTGNVLIGQGDMRLSADTVRVEYAEGGGAIARLFASGGVTLASKSEAAEAKEAVYTIDSGNVVMTGDVLLTQGKSALSGDKLTINLKTGSGTMDGRVKTIFMPGAKQ